MYKSDYSEDSLLEIFKGQDAVVSAIAGAAIGDQKKIIDIAEKAGVKRFLPSEYGCNTQNQETLKMVPVLKGKFDVVQYLKEKANSNENFSWTAVITGPFLDMVRFACPE